MLGAGFLALLCLMVTSDLQILSSNLSEPQAHIDYRHLTLQ